MLTMTRSVSRALLCAALAVAAVLLVGAFVPARQLRAVTTLPDSLLHLVGATLLTFLLVLARPARWRTLSLAVLSGGLLVEVLQPVVGRGAEGLDIAADVTGVIIGACLALILRSPEDDHTAPSESR